MISLQSTHEQMLAEILGPDEAFVDCGADPADPRLVQAPAARVELQAVAYRDLLLPLRPLLDERFGHVGQDRLWDDLIVPLKKGMSNAQHRGNLDDPSKQLTCRAHLTSRGAVVSISDEGQGFDVQQSLERFLRDEKYFTRMGSGFRKFHKVRSLVSYADGGSTFLIRFLCQAEPGRLLVDAERLGQAGDEQQMSAVLARHVPFLQNGEVELDSVRVFVPDEKADEQWDLKYELTCRRPADGSQHVRVLTARPLPPDEARVEFDVARGLLDQWPSGAAFRIPEPVALLDDPSLVLFASNPEVDLRRMLKKCSGEEAATLMGSLAGGLAALHDTDLELPEETPLEGLQRQRDVVERAVDTLEQHDAAIARRVEQVGEGLEQRFLSLSPAPAVPIHGDCGLTSFVKDDLGFQLVGFGGFRRGHPGFDLGAMVADLQRFYIMRSKTDDTLYPGVHRALLEGYAADGMPGWFADLPAFVSATLVLRLGRLLRRPPKKWASKVDPLVRLCEDGLRS